MPAPPHLVLVTIDESLRPLSIRVLGAYAQETLGIRTTLLVILKPLATFGHPVTFAPGEVRQLTRFLDAQQVTHLGFYLMTSTLKPYRLLTQTLRQAGFKGVIIAGGVHAALCPEESLVEGADFAVQGPGELPLKLIMDGADPSTIPGLVWRQQGAIRVNRQTPEQKLDLNILPFPLFRFDQDYVLWDGKVRKLTRTINRRFGSWHGRYYDLVTSRGCVYRCAYCCNVNGAPVRRMSVDRAISEVKQVRVRFPELGGINIQDDSFYAGSPEWLAEFSARMRAEVGLPFIVRMIPRFVTPERLATLKAGGLAYVTMGLEGSDRINKSLYNRPENSQSFIKAAKMILEARLLLSIDLIIHNPYESEGDLREIATTLNALPRPNWWVVSLSLTPFPGTPLHARCVKDKTLDRFATDAYDAMLMPSKPGGYLSPRFWLLLNTVVLPRVNPDIGAKLIALGPTNRSAATMVERISAYIDRTRRVTSWFRDRLPWLYRVTFKVIKRATGDSKHVGIDMLE